MKPMAGESKDDFMGRCTPAMVAEGHASDQAVAMCETMFEDKAATGILRRAHSVFTVKAVNEQQRIVSGMATTPTPDRYGDVVEPKGAQFNLPLPLLWQHDSASPVGHVTKAKVTNDGIDVEAQIQRIDEPGALKDLLDKAWQSVKIGLVRGFSIGFMGLEQAQIKDTWSYHFLKWDWLELSLVTIPANSEATIQVVKSIDDELMRGRLPRGALKLGAAELREDRRKAGAVFLR